MGRLASNGGFSKHLRFGGMEENGNDGCGPEAPSVEKHDLEAQSTVDDSASTLRFSRQTASISDSPRNTTMRSPRKTDFHGSASLVSRAQRWVTRSGFVAALRRICRHIAESRGFSMFTTFLTVYALLADDLRLRFTDAPADFAFSVVVIACIAIFTFEIFVSSFGKADYFLGFFFFLDVLATATLFLDIPSFADELHSDSEEGLHKAHGGRTARVAARASRTVRMLRLVRVVKLYKVAYDSKMMRPHAHRLSHLLRPGEELVLSRDMDGADRHHDDFEDADLFDKSEVQESALGKRLSDLTVRRVILLVIAMLIVLPLLLVDEESLLPRSAAYGADEVWYSWLTSKEDESSVSSALPELCEALGLSEAACPNDAGYSRYERNMLRYLYYHNWFSRAEGEDCDVSCPADYLAQTFWFGMASKDADVVAKYAEMAQLRESSVERWIEDLPQTDTNRYAYGSMPEEAAKVLSSAWSEECSVSGYAMRGVSLLTSQFGDAVNYPLSCPSELRKVERRRFSPGVLSEADTENLHMVFWFDLRPQVHAAAEMSLLLTAVVVFMLGVSVMLLNQDVNELVVLPVENMISKVAAIRNNPLAAVKLAEDEYSAEERMKSQKEELKASKLNFEKEHRGYKNLLFLAKLLSCRSLWKRRQELKKPMETVILEKTIVKLGSLLALGFGEAGVNIINQNMLSTGHETAAVNAMIPGSRVECIIAHCRIQNFSIITEALKERVITFVNQVAEIVHGVVTSFHGAPNKNNGGTFLLIWRTTDKDDEMVKQMADMALMAMAKCVGAIHSSDVLAKYRSHPGIQQRLGSNYRVDLSCGLHHGWAIEGAVGSEFKIDASYLSPNVTCAVHVEKAAQIYGVKCMLSNSLFELCTTDMQEKCRLVDRVHLSGSRTPLDLYSLDLATHMVDVEHRTFMGKWDARQRFEVRRQMESEKHSRCRSNIKWLFEEDAVVNVLRAPYTPDFNALFNMGYQNYVDGEWSVARDMLLNTALMLGFEDGPSIALLEFMAGYSWEAPEAWDGTRHLTGSSQAGAGTSRHWLPSRRNGHQDWHGGVRTGSRESGIMDTE